MLRELLIEKEKQLHEKGYLVFTETELTNMSLDLANKLKEHFHGIALMQLPDEEIAFFEWLKSEDIAVWNDLWANEEDPNMVSIDLLPYFIGEAIGFPICDLIDEPNYWFAPKHIKPKGTENFSVIEKKISANKNLTVDEALLVEVSQAPVDLWHFCYQYNYPVKKAKNIVRIMHRDDVLVHLAEREDLVKYIEI
jgi:hypothetical protein